MWHSLTYITLWTIRNDERHGCDKESRANAQQKELEDIQYVLPGTGISAQSPKIIASLVMYDIHKIAHWWLDTYYYKGTFAVTCPPDRPTHLEVARKRRRGGSSNAYNRVHPIRGTTTHTQPAP
jgi:hypothetical protein